MSFRYGYIAVKKGKATIDEDGNPIDGTDISITCDYQPTVRDNVYNESGSEIPIRYKLFIPPYSDSIAGLSKGDEVVCNGEKGTIARIFPTVLNCEVWVK